MSPLYRDPHFTFRFADDRRVDRFHLDGVAGGRRINVFRLDQTGDVPREHVATVHAGVDGWVELPHPLLVRAGEGFIAVPVRPDVD